MSYLTTGTTITQAKLNNLAVVSKSTTYTALATDDVIVATGSSSWTLTLPAANLNQDGLAFQRPVYVVNEGTGVVTISPAGADTFADGNTALAVNPGDAAVELVPDGVSKWIRVGGISPKALITQPELRGYRETKSAISIASNVLSVDLSTGNYFEFTANANITTTTITNIPASGKVASFVAKVAGDGTPRTWAWFTSTVLWAGGVVPTRTSTLNKRDFFVFLTVDGGATWFGFPMGLGL